MIVLPQDRMTLTVTLDFPAGIAAPLPLSDAWLFFVWKMTVLVALYVLVPICIPWYQHTALNVLPHFNEIETVAEHLLFVVPVGLMTNLQQQAAEPGAAKARIVVTANAND
jgi:hypothetical protein